MVDEAFLNDKNTVYPVIIDPSYDIPRVGASVEDAMLYSGLQNTAFGSYYYQNIGYYDSTYQTGRLLVKFPGLINDSTFQSLSTSRINEVTYHSYYSGNTSSARITAYIFNGPVWSEYTVKCSTAQWYNYSTEIAHVDPTSSGFYDYNITAAAIGWKCGAYNWQKGLLIKNDTSEYSSSYKKEFLATEYANHVDSSKMPYVSVRYDEFYDDHSNTYSGSTTIYQGTGTSGNINYAGDEDWFRFVPQTSGTYEFYTTGSTDTYGYLYNSSLSQLDYDDDGNGYPNFKLSYNLSACTTYYIRVRHYSSTGTGAYTLYVTGQNQNVPVISISLNKTSVTCNTGEIITLTATLNPSNATDKTVTYTSSNPSVLTFNGGAATVTVTQSDTYWQPRGAGTATVTATTSNGKIAICTFTVNAFDYNSGTYSSKLATDSAEYAMLAYDEMELSGGYYIDSKNRKNQPDALISKLQADGFTVTNDDAYNYPEDNNPDNVAYVLAKKQVYRCGQVRTLVAVIIRGTNRDEWQGNMDITGSSYNSSLNDHHSWKDAENDLKATLDTYKANIFNPVYLITGHSRGAAVANLLANTLTSSAGASNVFAYTFATPNATKNPTSRTNIFNFVFNDDFVTKSPLEGATTGWGYGKHGTTKTKVAEDLYSNSANASTFKADMKRFLGGREADYNYEGVLDLVEHVKDKWDDVAQYYNNSCFNGPTIPGTAIPITPALALLPTSWQTLYEFMHDEVAKAAMDDLAAKLLVATKAPNYYFGPISLFFIDGNALNNYIFDTHHAFTYYTAVKYGLFN